MQKKELVKEQEERCLKKMEEFNKHKEIDKTQKNNMIIEEQKQRILRKEEEAKRLEMMEAELLRRLQQTQQREREVFNLLESAMVDSSKPRRERYTKTIKGKSVRR